MIGRTSATVRLYAWIIWLVVVVLFGALRESWPSTEDEAGAFLAGMAWAFVLFWSMLMFVTWLWFVSVAR